MAKEMTKLEQYYNKFNEEKRLLRRHGNVEFVTSMHYIHRYLEKLPDAAILDIGAGTGRYSVALANEGYDVTAVELVRYNLGILKSKKSSVKAYQGNALRLSRFSDESFDVVLLFGPMYHLFSFADKKQALCEAKRVMKPDGVLFVAYCMNEFSVITHAFKEGYAKESVREKKLTADFQTVTSETDLYSYVRTEQIDELNRAAGLKRLQIIAADGPANYLRQTLREMDEETYALFLQYHLATCERADLLGASAHTVDILQK